MRHRPSAAGLKGKRLVFVLAGEVVGGAEWNAINLASYLARVHGASVQICALDDRPGRARAIAEAEGIPWSSIPVPWVGSRAGKTVSLGRTARRLRMLRPDVLLPSTNLPNVVCGLTWRLTGARLCVWNQCDVLGTRRFSRKLFRRALHATPLVITTAFHAREWLVAEWGVDSDRAHVIRSEVRLAAPREDRRTWRDRHGIDDRLAVCMLGHLHLGKEHATLLQAWRLVVDRLRAEGENPLLLLAGRGAGTEEALKAFAFDLDLRENVRFLGDVADVSALLGAVDFAVFTSVSEALGRGATEPMFAGLAVAGTDIPGIREAVGDEGHAFLAPAGDASGLADAILLLARDPGLRAQVGIANAELIRKRQSTEQSAGTYARLLAEALAGGSGRRVDEVPRAAETLSGATR